MQFNAIIRALDSLLKGGAALHAEIKPHLNRKGHAPAELIRKMAVRVARRYGCEAEESDTGWRFVDADGARHGAAAQFWRREIRAYDATPMSNRGGATSAQQDAVARLLKAYAELTAAERKRFLKSI
jgi:hypothetical protein